MATTFQIIINLKLPQAKSTLNSSKTLKDQITNSWMNTNKTRKEHILPAKKASLKSNRKLIFLPIKIQILFFLTRRGRKMPRNNWLIHLIFTIKSQSVSLVPCLRGMIGTTTPKPNTKIFSVNLSMLSYWKTTELLVKLTRKWTI